MHAYLIKHSCTSSSFPITILDRTCFLRSPGIDFVLVGECYYTKHYNNNNSNNNNNVYMYLKIYMVIYM